MRLNTRVFILTLVLCLSLSAMSMGQQSLRLPSIHTVGVGYVVVTADEIHISFNIETEAAAAEEAVVEHRDIIASIEEALQLENIAGLQYIPGRINIRARSSSTLVRSSVYRASSTLTVVFHNEKDTGRIVDVAMKHGAESVQLITFQASDLEEAAKEALTLAVKDAITKAEVISEATGTRIVDIINVRDNHDVEIFNPSDPVLVEKNDGPHTPYDIDVKRGEILVQVQVTAEFNVAVR